MSTAYCDSSFLLALYVEDDPFHGTARRLAAQFTASIPWTLYLELEVSNTIRRLASLGQISWTTVDRILRGIADDEAAGILMRPMVDPVLLFAKAKELSARCTGRLQCRTTDLMHVSAALVVEARVFASFDEKQRALARAAELVSLPVRR